jgi:CDP-diacylglycerol--glycerol-3-phosphate 3-phosphatidyltransferase
MTTANKVTVFRILLVPFFVHQILEFRDDGLQWHRWLALGTFAVVAAMDGVDGYIARRYNQRSELGAVLDPLADKLLLVSAVVTLSLTHTHLDAIPRWLVFLILSRDVLLVLGLGLIHFTVGSAKVRPRWTGKTATVLQMATVIWTMLRWPAPGQFWLAIGTGLLTAVSGIQYVWDGMHQLSASPRSSPSPRQ